jgi:D-galactarolactone cycloisomerase
MRKALGLDAVITCDANQSRTLSSARAFCDAIKELELSWFEEPIRVDASKADWLALVAASKAPLAGGENFHGE